MDRDLPQAGPDQERRPAAIGEPPVAPPVREPSDRAGADPAHAAPPSAVVPMAVTPAPGAGPAEPAGDARPGKKEEAQSFLRWVVEFVVLVGLAFALATGIKYWVVQPFYIPSTSMVPTLEIGDRVLVNKFIYRFQEPARGDVVVFVAPEDKNMDLIKRVIAVGGQTVSIDNGYVSVDGKRLDEPYVQDANRDTYTLPKPVRVPEGYVWVMGDNRANSSDSRVIGPQPVTGLLGKAFVIYWPVDRLKGL
jgi:signal peptidase I